ncbi:MAG: sodium:calcium antiporter [Planctomycetaceae bacterium]
MWLALAEFAVCAAVIIVAGTVLTRCADALADLTGFGRLLVGSILLAAATSLPELTVDVSAVRIGLHDMAVGDLMGSSLFNLLILAVIDTLHHSRGRLLSKASAAHALSATVSILLTTLAAAGILLGQRHHRTLLGVDITSLAILVAYVLGVRLVYYDQKAAAKAQDVLMPAGPKTTIARASAGFIGAAVAIFVAGPFMAEAAGKLADLSGLGGTFVGTTLVALSTSLPELVATLAAVRMGAFDLAVGNIFGSNAFNMVLLIPLDVVYREGSLLAAVSPNHALTCLATIIVTCVAVAGQLYQVERRLKFIEPDALLMIVLICGAIALLYVIR